MLYQEENMQILLVLLFCLLLRGEYAKFACSIICLSLESNISSPARYSYSSNFPHDKADIFAASLLITYCTFSSVILSSIIMISFHNLSARFFLKREGLSDARVASITKKEYALQYIFYKNS